MCTKKRGLRTNCNAVLKELGPKNLNWIVAQSSHRGAAVETTPCSRGGLLLPKRSVKMHHVLGHIIPGPYLERSSDPRPAGGELECICCELTGFFEIRGIKVLPQLP
jgi:hypothetical protein